MEDRHEAELESGIFRNELGAVAEISSSGASDSIRTSTSSIRRRMIGAGEQVIASMTSKEVQEPDPEASENVGETTSAH